MPVSVLQPTFTSGEISPRLAGRVDLGKYFTAVATLENFFPLPQGGVMRRPGSEFIQEVLGRDRVTNGDFASATGWTQGTGWSIAAGVATKSAGTASTLYSDADLVAGTVYEVVFTATVTAGQVRAKCGTGAGTWRTASDTYTERITAAGADENIYLDASSDFAGTIDNLSVREVNPETRLIPFQFSTEQAYMLELTDQNMRVYKDGGIIVSGDNPVEISAPWTASQIWDVRFAQSADTMYLVHGSVAPYKLTRTSHTAWTLTLVDWEYGPINPALNTEQVGLTLSLNTIGTGRTLTCGSSIFAAGDVGKFIAADSSSAGTTYHGVLKITAYTSATQVTCEVLTLFRHTVIDADEWYWGAFSDDFGWPVCVSFFQERLCLGHVQTVYFSESGKFESFGQRVNDTYALVDSDACAYTISSDQVDIIRWFVSQKRLLIGTTGNECWMSGGAESDAITPTSILTRPETRHGSAAIQPVVIGSIPLFIQRGGRKIREFVYSDQVAGYLAPEVSILAEHLTRQNEITDWCYQQSPHSLVWMVRDDGVMLALCYDKTNEVLGFSRITTDGDFKSCATIAGDNNDELWAVVERTIGGETRKYIERLGGEWSSNSTFEGAQFVDSFLTYDGPEATSITGADHLEGETVSILADGGDEPDQVISSGGVTLSQAASKVCLGLPYNSDFYPLGIDVGTVQGRGTTQGQLKRVNKLTVRVYQSGPFKVGKSATELRPVPFRADNLMGTSLTPLTNDVPLNIANGFDTKGQTFIRQDRPFPLTILALIPEVGF